MTPTQAEIEEMAGKLRSAGSIPWAILDEAAAMLEALSQDVERMEQTLTAIRDKAAGAGNMRVIVDVIFHMANGCLLARSAIAELSSPQGDSKPVAGDPCFDNRLDGEPTFTLLGRDPQGPDLIRKWADDRERCEGLSAKVNEARFKARQFENWKHLNPKPGMAASLYAHPPADSIEQAIKELEGLEENVARVLVPYCYGQFEDQTPVEEGSTRWNVGKPNQYALAAAHAILASVRAALSQIKADG